MIDNRPVKPFGSPKWNWYKIRVNHAQKNMGKISEISGLMEEPNVNFCHRSFTCPLPLVSTDTCKRNMILDW